MLPQKKSGAKESPASTLHCAVTAQISAMETSASTVEAATTVEASAHHTKMRCANGGM